jgi:hypothetical protein
MPIGAEYSVIWRLAFRDRIISCAVRLLPAGVDISVQWDGEEGVDRVFETAEEAFAWSDDEWAFYVSRGCDPVTPRIALGSHSESLRQ